MFAYWPIDWAAFLLCCEFFKYSSEFLCDLLISFPPLSFSILLACLAAWAGGEGVYGAGLVAVTSIRLNTVVNSNEMQARALLEVVSVAVVRDVGCVGRVTPQRSLYA